MVRAKPSSRKAPKTGATGAGETESGGPGEEKVCVSCGRRMLWRAKWRHNWAQVKTCSAACRKNTDKGAETLEQAILTLLAARARTATICPSEAARVVFGNDLAAWPAEAMERTRRAARRLVARGVLQIVQGGRVVDPSRARGPIRLRRIGD